MLKALFDKNKATLIVAAIFAVLQVFAYLSGFGYFGAEEIGARRILYLGLGAAIFVALAITNESKFNSAEPSGFAMVVGVIVSAFVGWLFCALYLLAQVWGWLRNSVPRKVAVS